MTTVIRDKDLNKLLKLSPIAQYNFLKDLVEKLDVFYLEAEGNGGKGIAFFDGNIVENDEDADEDIPGYESVEPLPFPVGEQVDMRRKEIAFDIFEENFETLTVKERSFVDYVIELEEIRFQYESVSD